MWVVDDVVNVHVTSSFRFVFIHFIVKEGHFSNENFDPL